MSIWNGSVSETQIKFKNRMWLYIISAVVLFLLIVPSLVVIPMSFSDSQYLEFPPETYSTRWYENYFIQLIGFRQRGPQSKLEYLQFLWQHHWALWQLMDW